MVVEPTDSRSQCVDRISGSSDQIVGFGEAIYKGQDEDVSEPLLGMKPLGTNLNRALKWDSNGVIWRNGKCG